eukprot:1317826-Amphidinium_carterae.1
MELTARHMDEERTKALAGAAGSAAMGDVPMRPGSLWWAPVRPVLARNLTAQICDTLLPCSPRARSPTTSSSSERRTKKGYRIKL